MQIGQWYCLALAVGNLAMRFKIKPNVTDLKPTELLNELEKRTLEQNISTEEQNDQENKPLFIKRKPGNAVKKKSMAAEDADKKEESLIRNFYDDRRKKRNFVKIQGQ